MSAEKHSPAVARAHQRAENLAWAAAGNYDIAFAPGQLAQHFDDAGLFENLASGLIRKHFDGQRFENFLAAWHDDIRAEHLDRVAWLAFANAACALEEPTRPALAELRSQWTSGLDEAQLDVLAELNPSLTSQDALEEEVRRILLHRYRFNGVVIKDAQSALHLGVALPALVGRYRFSSQDQRLRIMDAAPALKAIKARQKPGLVAGLLASRKRAAAARNRAYVERCFGPLALSEDDMAALEQAVCLDAHEGCRLWIADGRRDAGAVDGREFAAMQRSAQEQHARNLAFYREGARMYASLAKKLASALEGQLHASERLNTRGHATGTLDASRAWRHDATGDKRLFCRSERIATPNFSVDLLLDASGSRSDDQEAIATQAFILGQALAQCRIPVRICASCTIREYTVLRVLCDYDRSEDLPNVFRYFAAGMNRDGLMLRAAGQLISQAPLEKHLLIVLTDASPMDTRPMRARREDVVAQPAGTTLAARMAQAGSGGGNDAMAGRVNGLKMPSAARSGGNAADERLEVGYVGKPAYRDAAEAVRSLRRVGISVAAIFTGDDSRAARAAQMYGASSLRIRSMQRLADAAAALIINATR